MFRHTSFRVGLLTVLGSLLLVLSLSAFTGTASAATAATTTSTTTTSIPQYAHLSAHVVGQARSSSTEVLVSGSGFRSGFVFLSATVNGRSVSVQPALIRTNRNGSFSQLVRINLPSRSFPGRMFAEQITLYASGRSGQASTQVYLNRPFPFGFLH
jgi:hypothetical protein